MLNPKTGPHGQPAQMQVLIVDDDAIIRLVHEKIVRAVAPELPIVAAKNGEEAIECVQADPSANIHFLVLLDLNMPVMNGWEFLETCQEKKIEYISVVMVTSSIDSADRRRALQLPRVIDFYEKPLVKSSFQDILSSTQ